MSHRHSNSHRRSDPFWDQVEKRHNDIKRRYNTAGIAISRKCAAGHWHFNPDLDPGAQAEFRELNILCARHIGFKGSDDDANTFWMETLLKIQNGATRAECYVT